MSRVLLNASPPASAGCPGILSLPRDVLEERGLPGGDGRVKRNGKDPINIVSHAGEMEETEATLLPAGATVFSYQKMSRCISTQFPWKIVRETE